MIAVFDTNIFIAVIVTEGVCSNLLRRACLGELSLISCPFIREEIRTTLSRKFHLTSEEIASALEPVCEAVTQLLEHDVKIEGACRDASDDNIMACAVAAKADYLVTGDADLLEIGVFQGIEIITPRNFEALFL